MSGTERGDVIGPGCRVRMHFAIQLAEGTEVESSFGDEPIQFTVGDGTLFERVEALLFGLRAGERRVFELEPDQAYGFPDADNVHALALGDFPPDIPLEPGTVVGFTAPEGGEVPGTVLAVEGDRVTVDFSHPLAGHRLTFEVHVLAVECPAEGAGAGLS